MYLQLEKVLLVIWTVLQATFYCTLYIKLECTFIYTLGPLIDQAPPPTNYACRHKHNL